MHSCRVVSLLLSLILCHCSSKDRVAILLIAIQWNADNLLSSLETPRISPLPKCQEKKQRQLCKEEGGLFASFLLQWRCLNWDNKKQAHLWVLQLLQSRQSNEWEPQENFNSAGKMSRWWRRRHQQEQPMVETQSKAVLCARTPRSLYLVWDARSGWVALVSTSQFSWEERGKQL
jgi:hypothetical protein